MKKYKEKKGQEEVEYRSLREYSRVDGYIPIDIRLLSDEERLTARSRTSLENSLTQYDELPEPHEKALTDCLRILNAKLDTIIKLLAFQARDYGSLRHEDVNISAGGLSAFVAGDFQPGNMVEIRLMLPNAPYAVFYIYGLVVSIEEVVGRQLVSVEFTLIDDDIREQIVKYVFERQREILRQKRR
jgi:PilZ domain